MKKFALFCGAALLLSTVSVGCSSDGTSWCRTGSLFPTVRAKEAVQTVYTTAGRISNCDPCEPAACAPCEPVCNPCEPACDPCVPSCPGIYTPSVTPGPVQ